MTQENLCPACGAPLGINPGSECPSCGSALPAQGNNSQTIISSKSSFNNSAEAMDEVKRLISEGEIGAATEVVSKEFGQSLEAAQSSVEQTRIDTHYMRDENPLLDSSSNSAPTRVIDAPGFEEPKQPSNTRKWIIGGSIAAVIFLCACCCLPLIGIAIAVMRKG